MTVCRVSQARSGAAKFNPSPIVLAAVVALSAGDVFLSPFAPRAMADEEEQLSPYEKRQRELEKRRELLRQARETAEQRAADLEASRRQAMEAATSAVEESNASRKAAAEKLKEDVRKSTSSYGITEAAKPFSFSAPTPAPSPKVEPADKAEAPWWTGLSEYTEGPVGKKEAAPAPTPATPKKVEAVQVQPPKPAPAAKVVVSEPAKAAPAAKSGKRAGPLPLWFAQFLLLGLFGALFVAITKFQDQFLKACDTGLATVVKLYRQLESALPASK